MAMKKAASKELVVPGKLTDAEQDLLSQMENGYTLRTDVFCFHNAAVQNADLVPSAKASRVRCPCPRAESK